MRLAYILFSVMPIIKTFPGFLTQLSFTDQAAQNFGRAKRFRAKLVMQITAAVRARIWSGLEARAEFSGVLRDGALEVLPLFGLGAAF